MNPTPPEPLSPTPAWLRSLAVACVVATFALIGLGSVVTTFRVGMADPVWPTTPWYLFFIDWTEPSRGFLIEHAHRLAAFAVGGLVALFALLAWLREPSAGLRWTGFVALVGLLVAFGAMHRELLAQVNEPVVTWPTRTIAATLLWFGVAVICGLIGVFRPGGGLRLAAVLLLGAVMIQGLLGGLRVRLNELIGTDLAAVHGIFAQVFFAAFVAVMAVMYVRRWSPPESVEGGLGLLSWGLVGVLVVQLVFGALLRHTGWVNMQRLHFLTAFVALGGVVWLAVVVTSRPAARAVFGGTTLLLVVLVGLQVALGVEAWLSKFSQGILPELQTLPQTVGQATTRTLHVLTGAGLLAAATALATRTALIGRPVQVEPSRPLTPARTGDERPSPVGIHA